MKRSEILKLPIENRLELLANTYRAINDYLNAKTDRQQIEADVDASGFTEQQKGMEVFRRQVAELSEPERAELAEIFKLQEKFHLAIPLPPFYMKNLETVHLSVLDDIRNDPEIHDLLTRWAKFQSDPENVPDFDTDTGLLTPAFAQKMEDAGIGFEQRTKFMQFVSDRKAFHWQRIEPELFRDFVPMQFRAFDYDTASDTIRGSENSMITHSTLSPQQRRDLELPESDASPYAASCIVTNLNGRAIGLNETGGLAAHEPGHTEQKYLHALLKAGVITEGHPYYEVAKIFSFREEHGVGSAPPGLMRKAGDTGPPREALFRAGFDAYLSVPHERASFHVDERMSLALGFYYLPDEDPYIQNVVPQFDRMHDAVVLDGDQDTFREWYAEAFDKLDPGKQETLLAAKKRAVGEPKFTA